MDMADISAFFFFFFLSSELRRSRMSNARVATLATLCQLFVSATCAGDALDRRKLPHAGKGRVGEEQERGEWKHYGQIDHGLAKPCMQ